MKSVLKQAYDCLKEHGFDVYFPGQHKGECTESYVVVKREGATELLSVSSERPIYTVMCYVPEGKYSTLEEMASSVREAMKDVYPAVMYAGNETPDFFDDSINGWMRSFQYEGIKKIQYMNI